MLIKNENQQQHFGFQMDNMMNNNMNMINFNNVNLGMNINNNMNDNLNDIIKESNEKIIPALFLNKNNGKTTGVNISQNKTMKELLNLYMIKIWEDLDFLKKNAFWNNGKKIDPNDNRTILEYGIKDYERIEVVWVNIL